ncbi:Cytochrome C oxidase, cbb3-type, subunit III [Saccharicrinis carchari]|uniref:Cytochrome C oxidase, cbb3-type, subunit III n=1 Tax=Saccharicrinis carchari TaxID=1168039 RepID=A0A521EQE1_SACCC|nr:cytochrome c [Saccharicrinis carchari]SMO86146.1 Cytochrome C oxidase, cbb3-type, subunit III [Saccharicrinis carchari]
MKFLTFISVLILFIGSIACKQNTNDTNSSDAGNTLGTSPASSIKNRNSRFDAGKLVYDRNCKVCHQANRMGMPRVYPPLKNTKRVNGDKDYLIDIMLNGMSGEIIVEGIKYNGVMAAYRNLSNQQIADVLNYIRSDGQAANDLVTPADVKQKR